MITILAGIAGLILLYYGAEFLVKGGSSIAMNMKIPPLVIGLTLVAYATSAPEMVVSIDAATKGMGDISLGNVVGSNICNIALILGVCAIITPLKVNRQLLKFDIWVMLTASAALAVLYYLTGGVNRIAGGILLLCSIAYTVWSVYAAKRDAAISETAQAEETPKVYPLYLAVIFVAGGLAALVGGAKLFVFAAVALAKLCNVSDAVIGLTVVAVGTSLPELATSIVAAIKKETDIAIGNVIGSNIFNILAILGVAPLVKPIYGVGINNVDMILMIALGIVLYPFMRTGMKINRFEGAALLLIYIGYTAYLIVK